MSLAPGTRFGRYEVLGLLGAGGMGEVYRAWDERLGREVAVKVLPEAVASDPERLRRFEAEARAAGALNHANVLAVFDVGHDGGSPYVVSELLEGETLRERLAHGLPVRKAVDLAAQIAQGLAAAHDKGIVHRDLKPENVFVTRDGRAKILDFGLAKLRDPLLGSAAGDDEATRSHHATGAGTVLGTVGYMSPEQVRGVEVDHRSDVFALGVVLYEMLAGERAFSRPTAPEVMTAILREDVPPPSAKNPEVGLAVDRVVARCLDKQPEERFQSARDVAFALEAVTGASASGVHAAEPSPPRGRWRRALPLLLLPLAVALVAATAVIALRLGKEPPPSFVQLTFRRVELGPARFAPDGDTVLYAERRPSAPGYEVYSTRSGSRESRALGLDAQVLAISSSGELAVALDATVAAGLLVDSTLARVPLAGGAPREVLDEVVAADWAPGGEALAVARRVEDRVRLEYPLGKLLHETAGNVSNVRVSPDGTRVAFVEHQPGDHIQGAIAIASQAGGIRIVADDLFYCRGLAWTPDGSEVWYSSLDGMGSAMVHASTPGGRTRLVTRMPGWWQVEDVSRAGRVLLARHDVRSIVVLGRSGAAERDLSWHDSSSLADISRDGSTILFNETTVGGGTRSAVYLRRADGSPAVRLGDGFALALSPDGRWVLTTRRGRPPRLAVLPTRAGEVREFEADIGADFRGAGWFPDSRRFVFARGAGDGRAQLFVQDIEGGPALPTRVSGGDLRWPVVAPDGQSVAALGDDATIAIHSLETGTAVPMDGVEPGEVPLQWSPDGSRLYVYQLDEVPVRIYLVSRSGERRPWKEIDLPGQPPTRHVFVALNPDGSAWAWSYTDSRSELYVADRLR